MLKKVLFNNLMLDVTFQLTRKANITVSNDSTIKSQHHKEDQIEDSSV